MYYLVTIDRRFEDRSLKFYRQQIWVKSGISTESVNLKEYLVSVIFKHKDELTDKCIYNSELEKNDDCRVEIIPFAVKPEYLQENQYIKDILILPHIRTYLEWRFKMNNIPKYLKYRDEWIDNISENQLWYYEIEMKHLREKRNLYIVRLCFKVIEKVKR